MYAFERLAEARIQEAEARGELSGLPGEGRPLVLDDDSLVPETLRAAYRILRNAGFAPEPVRLRAALAEAAQAAARSATERQRAAAITRLAQLAARLEASGHAEHAASLNAYLDGTVQAAAPGATRVIAAASPAAAGARGSACTTATGTGAGQSEDASPGPPDLPGG